MTGRESSSRARTAPATIAAGALSPPMPSTAMGSIDEPAAWEVALSERSVDVDGLAAAVPTAVPAHHVGHLGQPASGAQASGRHVELPGRGPTAPALGLGGLLLGDGHGEFLGVERDGAQRCTEPDASGRC